MQSSASQDNAIHVRNGAEFTAAMQQHERSIIIERTWRTLWLRFLLRTYYAAKQYTEKVT